MFEAIDRWMRGFVESRLLGLPAPVAALFLYFLLNFALSAWLGGTIWFDDREQMIHMQSWEWGYKGTQPPLYTWLVKCLDLVLGDDRVSVLAARYVLLFATTALLYTAGRLAGFSKAASAAAAIGCMLAPQFSWEGQRSLSHSLMLMFGIVLTVNAVLLVHRDGGRAAYLLLGLGIAATLLGKYSGLFVLAAIAAAALGVPEMRRSFSLTGLCVALLLAAAVMAMPVVWLADHAGMAGRGLTVLHGSAETDMLVPRIAGALSFANAFLLYAAVPIVVTGVCLAIARRRGLLEPSPPQAPATERFLVAAVAGLVVFAFLAVVAAGTPFVNVSWMHPLILGPLAVAPALSRHARRDVVNGGIVFAGLLSAAACTVAIVVAKLLETGVI